MPKKNRAAGWIAVLLVTPLAAGEAIVTDRPDQTESASVIAVGSVQVEAGFRRARDREDAVSLERGEAGSTLARLGVLPRTELRLGFDGRAFERTASPAGRTRESGAGDASLGAKVLLRSAGPALALLLDTSLPWGSRELTSDRLDPAARLSVAHELSDRVGLGYNIGIGWDTAEGADGGRDTLSSGLYTASLGFSLTDRLGSFVELYGELPASAGGRPSHSFDAGWTYLVRDNLQLDGSGGVSLSGSAEDWFLGLGVSVRWPH